MYKKTKLSLLVSSALLAQSAFSMQAMAAEEAASQEAAQETSAAPESHSDMERISVTTRKMDETIEKIPLSISVLNHEDIENKGIGNTEDVSKYSAALSFDVGAAPNDTRPAIRGLTTERGRPNVAILVDGVDVSSESLTLAGGGMTANMRLMDLQQVEIVKGPQSANYGRSAFSGAINYVTKRPSFDFGAKVDVNGDENGTAEAALLVEGGLTEKLAASIKVASWETDGAYDNPNNGEDLGAGESVGGALSLYYVDDSFTAYWRTEYSDEEYSQRPVVLRRSMNQGTPADMATNPFATGSLNVDGGAVLLPYEEGADCSQAQPYWDSFADLAPFVPGATPEMFAPCRPFVAGRLDGDESEIDLSNDPRTGKGFSGTEVENLRSTLTLEWDFDNDISFMSQSSITQNDTYIQEDFDLTDYSIWALPGGIPEYFIPPVTQYGMSSDSDTGYEVEQFSQEFRLSGGDETLSWVASVLYWEESMDVEFGSQWWMRDGVDVPTLLAIFAQSPYTSFITAANTGPSADNRATPLTRDTEHWSVAGLVKYALTDSMNITLEGRYIDETLDYTGDADDRGFLTAHELDNSQIYDPTIPPFGAMVPNPNYHTTNSVSDTEFVPRVSLDWQVNDTVFTYASAAKGFKPGGVNTADGNGDVSSGEYKPETLWAYEIGAKAFSEENNAMVSIAAFYWDYTDQQTPFTVVDQQTGMANTATINAGETSVTGFEMEAMWLMSDNFTWTTGYVYSDAQYEDFNVSEAIAASGLPARISKVDQALSGNAEGDYSGNQLPLSAEHSLTTSFKYTQEFGSLEGFAELFGQYRSKRYIDSGEKAYLPEYDEWDLNVGVIGKNWKVIAYVENLFDDDKIKSALGNVDYGFFPNGSSVPWGTQYTLPQPRTAGIRASYSF
ncbi:TonB-dependent receptor [Thalassomonas sp. M1454]|uniref:TonB-dependent receptor n=1 Tax=Thalassomonas sp. M1454 TaxID=2594477 RepID=UPI00117F0C16|nr:TonB-dependent receptor [Thalassomonas sp. M1454]TRX55019.1 TonB-dependent receptor [Thalassomonas sp. M1454]